MAKSKKALDKDQMFKKILPALSDNPYANINSVEPTAVENEVSPDSNDQNLSALRNKLFSPTELSETSRPFAVINVVESLVLQSVDLAVQKFNSCSCDRCRSDIIAIALNMIHPKYIVAEPSQIDRYIAEASTKEVTSDLMKALVKAVIQVRTTPRH